MLDPLPVKGVRFAAIEAGLRYRDRPDLLLIEAAEGTAVGGVLTRSAVPGHPVPWCREVVARGRARAVIANAGTANVFRGEEGDRAVRAEAKAVADAIGCRMEEVLVASTGVIGQRLPVERIEAAVPDLVAALAPDGIETAAAAIMTTDTFPKWASRRADIAGRPVTVTGIAKGSGMIAPDMATMLAFVATDALLPAPLVQRLVEEGADQSFNAITVDGDASTSDTLLLLATGKAGNPMPQSADDPALAGFRQALFAVLKDLALMVVKDGEGATKLVEIRVDGAESDASARRIGLEIANSPLVKTAIAGGDANWGRVLMAIGNAGEKVDLPRIGVAFGGFPVARNGGAVPDLDEAPIDAHLKGREILIEATVGIGPGKAAVWTCDLTHGYIDINADYRS
ncbi:MAG: bifunctional glutamate N-acetyltransferase/amino-acid acetyltransferase ArgJ [Geminicoccaceae bacterium]|nr:bifunctional glutamate N-acetyltransferase/amino-acid acetyltransferase ArgJ [Geminicoccaceae bacterium]